MEGGRKMTCLAAALAALLFAAAVNCQGLAPDVMAASTAAERQVVVSTVPTGSDVDTLVAATPAPAEATDMVPVTPARGLVMLVSAGDAATLGAAAPMCLQCRCCSKSEPSKCEITRCCSTYNCDPSGKCNVVQKQCGCTGC